MSDINTQTLFDVIYRYANLFLIPNIIIQKLTEQIVYITIQTLWKHFFIQFICIPPVTYISMQPLFDIIYQYTNNVS